MNTAAAIAILAILAGCATPPQAQCTVKNPGKITKVDGKIVITQEGPPQLDCKPLELEKDPLSMNSTTLLPQATIKPKDPRTP